MLGIYRSVIMSLNGMFKAVPSLSLLKKNSGFRMLYASVQRSPVIDTHTHTHFLEGEYFGVRLSVEVAFCGLFPCFSLDSIPNQ